MMGNLGITLLVLVMSTSCLKDVLGDNTAEAEWDCSCSCNCGESSQFANSPPSELQSLAHPQQYSGCLCAAGPCSCSCNCGPAPSSPKPPKKEQKPKKPPSPPLKKEQKPKKPPSPPLKKERKPKKPPSPKPPMQEQKPKKPPSPKPPKQEQPKNPPPSPKPPRQEQPGNYPYCQVEDLLITFFPFEHRRYRDCWCSLSYSYGCDVQIWNSLVERCVNIDANCCSVYCQLPENCRLRMFGNDSPSFDYAVRQYCY